MVIAIPKPNPRRHLQPTQELCRSIRDCNTQSNLSILHSMWFDPGSELVSDCRCSFNMYQNDRWLKWLLKMRQKHLNRPLVAGYNISDNSQAGIGAGTERCRSTSHHYCTESNLQPQHKMTMYILFRCCLNCSLHMFIRPQTKHEWELAVLNAWV